MASTDTVTSLDKPWEVGPMRKSSPLILCSTTRMLRSRSSAKYLCWWTSLRNLSHEKSMRKVEHKTCVKLYDVIYMDDYVFIIMELVEGSDLLDFINSKKYLSEKTARALLHLAAMHGSSCHTQLVPLTSNRETKNLNNHCWATLIVIWLFWSSITLSLMQLLPTKQKASSHPSAWVWDWEMLALFPGLACSLLTVWKSVQISYCKHVEMSMYDMAQIHHVSPCIVDLHTIPFPQPHCPWWVGHSWLVHPADSVSPDPGQYLQTL